MDTATSSVRRWVTVGVLLVGALLGATQGRAQTFTPLILAWDPNPEPNVAGYIVYVNRSQPTEEAFDVGFTTTFTYPRAIARGVGYVIWVVAYGRDGMASPRSLPLFYIRGLSTQAPGTAPTDPAQPTSEPAALPAVESRLPGTVLTGDAPVTGMAPLPDGRLLVVEGAARLRLVDPLSGVAPVLLVSLDGQSISGVAVDPRFENSRFIFVASAERRGPAWQTSIVRYREVSGTLGERAVLVSGLESPAGSETALAVGRDGRIYVAIGSTRERPVAYQGSVLRFEADGTVSRGNLSGSPVYVRGMANPSALAVDTTERLWIADGSPSERPVVSVMLETARTGTSVPMSAPFAIDGANGLRSFAVRQIGATYEAVAVDHEGGIWRIVETDHGMTTKQVSVPADERVERAVVAANGSILASLTRSDGAGIAVRVALLTP